MWVQPLDVTTLAGVCALILGLAMAVSLRPAVRAGRVELARLLREE
jgi:ABC-type lipoprotein release transport system permease subunit